MADLFTVVADRDCYFIRKYGGSGSASVTDGRPIGPPWTTRAEAQAAADRVNAGDETGIQFGLFADD